MGAESVELILFFGVFAVVGNWMAWEKGFFKLPKVKPAAEKEIVLPVRLKMVLGTFAIYLISSLAIAPLLARIFFVIDHLHPSFGVNPSVSMMGWVQFITICLTICLMVLFCYTQDVSTIKRVWKDRTKPGSRSIIYDFGLGVLCWFLSFPLVVVISELSEAITAYFVGHFSYEQVAVRYLEMATETPWMLIVALMTILVAAPMIEEFLFRGMLQNWLKTVLGNKAAITLTALCFALFHLAPSQGIGNVSLVISLFTFACFLGFIYERQRSLFASIGLHMAFNTVSCLRILTTNLS